MYDPLEPGVQGICCDAQTGKREENMPRNVSVNSGAMRFAQNISVGAHVFQADEPIENGGNDAGPNPHELLLAALGACASVTVQMYADSKQWPLEEVYARLSYVKVPAKGQPDARLGWWTELKWRFPAPEVYPKTSNADCWR